VTDFIIILCTYWFNRRLVFGHDIQSCYHPLGPPMVSQYPQPVIPSSGSETAVTYQTSSINQYSIPPAPKRHRWESGGSDSEMNYAGEFYKCIVILVH